MFSYYKTIYWQNIQPRIILNINTIVSHSANSCIVDFIKMAADMMNYNFKGTVLFKLCWMCCQILNSHHKICVEIVMSWMLLYVVFDCTLSKLAPFSWPYHLENSITDAIKCHWISCTLFLYFYQKNMYLKKFNFEIMVIIWPRHLVCKPASFVPVPSQDKLGGLCQESILHRNGGDDGGRGTD